MRRPGSGPGRPGTAAALLLLMALLLGAPRPALGAVNGTSHDMTRFGGDIFEGPCVYCHVPHKAQGERLWVSNSNGPATGWGSRPIAQLCYTCHEISGGGFEAHDVTDTAYTDTAHGYVVSEIPPGPDGAPQLLAALPYVETGMLDCTTCHDPHGETPPFIREGGIDALCISCHGRANPGAVGADNSFGSEEAAFSLHPSDVPYEDIAGNGTTLLEVLPESLQVPTAAGSWRLGAHRVGWQPGAGNISCQTCHPVHGGWNYNSGILPGPPASSLTPVENAGRSPSVLCQSCHQGGDPAETVGSGTDHPINTNDGTPLVTYPSEWPSGPAGEVTCSSCHDVHGAMGGSSLLRKGGNATDGWCFSCHVVTALLPPYHHSTRENDDPSIFASVLTCGDCHGAGAGWTAHSGFDGFKVAAAVDRSALCESCHDPLHPPQVDEGRYRAATGLEIRFAGATQPALHGPLPGKVSHVVDVIDMDRIANCRIKTTPWPITGRTSRYGAAGELICESCHSVLGNAGLLLGNDETANLTGGWKTNLLLEPYEDNSPGVGIESPDFVPGVTRSALCRGCHLSEREGTAASFVHNPEAHTVEGYSYPEKYTPYGRRTTSVLTVPNDPRGEGCPEVSSADQLAAPSNGEPAPGAFSYPAPNEMDCDSCHRPHGAHDASDENGKRILLELTGPGSHGTVPCLECHDTTVQCGFTSPTSP